MIFIHIYIYIFIIWMKHDEDLPSGYVKIAIEIGDL